MKRRRSQTFSPSDLLSDVVYEGAQILWIKWQRPRQPFKSPQVVLKGREVDIIKKSLTDVMSLR